MKDFACQKGRLLMQRPQAKRLKHAWEETELASTLRPCLPGKLSSLSWWASLWTLPALQIGLWLAGSSRNPTKKIENIVFPKRETWKLVKIKQQTKPKNQTTKTPGWQGLWNQEPGFSMLRALWFSTFLSSDPLLQFLRLWGPPTITFSLLHHNGSFATVMNHNVNLCAFRWP